MQRHRDGNSSGVPSRRPNAFAPEFLDRLQEESEPLTASEADLSGPWKLEAVPGHPGAVAVLREWESLDKGDLPEAVFLDRETAALFAAILPVVDREPLYHEGETVDRLTIPLPAVRLLIEIAEAKGRQEALTRRVSEAALEELRQRALLESVESSCRLAGITVAPDRLRQLALGENEPETIEDTRP